MNTDELGQVGKKTQSLIRKGYFRGKKIYLFGASDHTRQVIQILREYEMEPEHVLDNDKRKRHSFCAGVEVISPEDVADLTDENYAYVIYSLFWREMKQQLLRLGVPKERVICLYERDKKLPERLYEAYQGKNIYERIRNRYGELPVLFCPYTGTGDIYLIGTFLNRYIRQEKLDEFVFLVINNACRKVADIFRIPNVEVLNNLKEGECLIRYYLLCPDRIPLKVLNDSWTKIPANKLEWFRGYKGWNFMELFRTFVFDLPDDALPEKPVFADADEELDRIFEENHLIPGRTVVIAPYSNTLADLPESFWSGIVTYLHDKGYAVCTNCGGPAEPPLPDTVPASFSLTIAPQFVSKAGWFIGVRSGLCDVISAADAVKIVLYDRDNWFYNCSAYEYFSLNHMGLCDDAVELQFDNKHLQQCSDEIIRILMED